MNKNTLKEILFNMCIIFVLGLILILLSSIIGEKIGEYVIDKRGMMDTNEYERIVLSNTVNFRTVGIIMSLFGSAGIMLNEILLCKGNNRRRY